MPTEAKATEATEAYARRVPHVTLERLYLGENLYSTDR